MAERSNHGPMAGHGSAGSTGVLLRSADDHDTISKAFPGWAGKMEEPLPCDGGERIAASPDGHAIGIRKLVKVPCAREADPCTIGEWRVASTWTTRAYRDGVLSESGIVVNLQCTACKSIKKVFMAAGIDAVLDAEEKLSNREF